MDPGTAVGVASLGIQVCHVLLEYYRDWKDYKDDIRDTYTEISELSKTLDLLNSKLENSPGAALKDRAKECITTCQQGIEQLDKKLKKIRREAPTGYKNKIKAEGLRLVYPFRKSTLDKLKGIVLNLMQHLSLALQLLQLDTSNSTKNTTSQIKDTVDEISHLTSKIQTSALDTQSQVSTTATLIQALITKDEQTNLEKILIWLSASDRSVEHYSARKKYEAGTGEWLLKGRQYQDWISGASPLLWVHGKAGCFKTVLLSTIIEDVRGRLAGQHGSVLAYFYFTFADAGKQTYRSLLLSLVTELSRENPIHPVLQASYEASLPNAPLDTTLENILMALLQDAQDIYVAIDALDECPQEQREEVVDGLQSVVQACPSTKLLITSRKEANIEELMDSWCIVQLALDESCVNADIDIYVHHALATDRKLRRLPDATKAEIERVFHAKSDGMFRWATLQLQALRNLKVLQPSYISNALYKMPRTLDETYERMLAAIEDLYFDEARTALQWLVFTNAPLSIAELAEACSISYTSETVPFLKHGGHADIMGLLNVLGNLILVGDPIPYHPGTEEVPDPPKYDPEFHQRRVRLSHFSVQEYLVSDRLRESVKHISTYALHEVESSYDLAQRCCAYLMYFVCELSPQVQKWIDYEHLPYPDVFASFYGSVSSLDHWDRFEPQYPLLGYCSRQWTEHLRLAESSMGALPEENPLHLQVLEQEKVTATWLRLGQTDRSLKGQPEERYWFRSEKGMEKKGWNDKTRALYWASSFRLPKTVSLLCDLLSRQDKNYEDGKTGTVLQASAYWGNLALVKALLKRGSNANLKMGPHGSPLQAAAKGGFMEIVSVLLEAAFNQGILRTCMGNTVPHVEIQRQSMQTLKSFLKTVDIISDDDSPQSQIFALLKSAVKDCSEAIVKHKNQAVSDVYRLSPEFQLLAAAEECEEWAGIVLEINTAVSSVLDGLLLSAIEQNRGAVAKALIGAGAHITRASFQEAIRLMSLGRVEEEAMAELLVYSGLEIAGDHEMLLAATSVGSAKLAKLLLEAGADVHGHTQKFYNHFETESQNFRLHTENALLIAIRREDLDMVKLLLDWAADPNEEFTLSISSYANKSVVECRITALAITVYLAFTGSICTKTGNAVVQKLIAAGVNGDAVGTAICQSIECSIFVNASDTLDWIQNGVIGEVVDLLSDDHTYINGPLAATPTLCQRSHKLGYDVIWSVQNLLAIDRGSRWSLHLCIDDLQDLLGTALLSSVLIGREEGVSLLLKKGEEAKTMDTSRACELLTAACWTYLRPKDCVKIITMLLDSLLQLRGAEDDVFEGILDGGCLKISMDRFLKPGDRQTWTARIKALVQERRASFRGGHDGNSGVDSDGRVL